MITESITTEDFKKPRATGKWAQERVPHKGWECVAWFDTQEPNHICQMCETQECRFVHTMYHADYPETLDCGRICAGHMEGDYQAAGRRERKMHSEAEKLKRQQKKEQSDVLGIVDVEPKEEKAVWTTSMRGNPMAKRKKYCAVVFEYQKGRYHGKFGFVILRGEVKLDIGWNHFDEVSQAKSAAWTELLAQTA